jgi:thiamine-phosphate diphosphorylase
MTRRLICLVTDRHRLSPDVNHALALDTLVNLVQAAAHAGVDLIQIRERDLHARDLTTLTERCVAAVTGTASRVIVSDRVDVALAAGADGVHLRSDSIDAMSVRRLVSPEFTVGQSVHSAEEAVEAVRRGGIDYVILGTMFPSRSKLPAHTLAGLDELAQACAAVPVPVLAIGGIDANGAAAAARAGASGIAAIGFFIPPRGTPFDRYLEGSVADVRRAFDSCGVVP